MLLNFELIINSLIIILLFVASFLIIELARTVYQIRKLIKRLDFLTDVKEWVGLLKVFKKKQ